MQIPRFIQSINNRLILVTPHLIKNKPLFLGRYFYRILANYFYQKRKIRSILLHTHYKCNLNCSHCYEKEAFTCTDAAPLSLQEKKRIIKELWEVKPLSFDFVSGESSLDPDLPELVKACRPERTYITLATNGYDFSEEKIRHLRKIGIDKMNVSVDSWYPEEHDALRGKKGSHQRAFQTIELCKKVGMGFHITIFVFKNSTKSEGFRKLVKYSIENKVRVAFKLAIPLGHWQGKIDDLITNDDRETVDQLYSQYPFLKTCDIGNRNGGCPAFDELICVTAYGDVLPCNGIHISLGNLREERLKDIQDKGRKIKCFNGEYRGCLPAQNKDFINKYLSKTYDVRPYPVKAESVFKEL